MDVRDAQRSYFRDAAAAAIKRVTKVVAFDGAPTAASLATSLTGSNNDLDFTAQDYGTDGNDISIKYTNPGLPSQALAVSVDGNDIDVSLATGAGTNEVQTVTVVATGGSFILGWHDQFTAPIAYGASATAVKDALEGILGVGNVGVSKSGSDYVVTFQGDLAAANVSQLSIDGNRLTPHNPKISVRTTVPGDGTHNEVQKFSLQNAGVGTFTLDFDGQTTSALAYNASAATVQTALRALSNINGANVTVSKSGDEYTVTFVSSLGNANQPQLTGDVSGLRVASVATTTPGVAPAITSTAAQIKTALDADDDAAALINVANHSGNDGTGVVTAMNKTYLTGGKDGIGAVADAATYTTSLTGTQNDLVYTAKASGKAGDGIRIQYVDPGGASATLGVVTDLDERLITVNLGRAASAINSTAADVKAAIEADTDGNSLVSIANAGGNDGTGLVTAMSVQTLTGGGEGVAALELFNVHGSVLATVIAMATETLAGSSATLKVGTAGDDDALMSQITATNLAAGRVADKGGVVNVGTAPNTTPVVPLNDGDVVQAKPETADITDGTVTFVCYYQSVSEGGRVVPVA